MRLYLGVLPPTGRLCRKGHSPLDWTSSPTLCWQAFLYERVFFSAEICPLPFGVLPSWEPA